MNLLAQFVDRCSVSACLAATLVVGHAVAQQVTVSARIATPMQVGVVDPAMTDSAVLPAGPLPSSGDLLAQASAGSFARYNWYQTAGMANASFNVTMQALAGVQSSATCSEVEIVIEVSAPTARPVRLVLDRLGLVDPGQAWPLVSVDVGNDGSIEQPNVWPGSTDFGLINAGPVPSEIKLTMSAAASGGVVEAAIFFNVLPWNQVSIVRSGAGCFGPGTQELVRPIFADRGVELLMNGLIVLGASAKPTILSPSSPLPFLTTCLLIPSPDILVWQPFPGLVVPLPSAVRPVEFHVQSVFPSQLAWSASDAFRVQAY